MINYYNFKEKNYGNGIRVITSYNYGVPTGFKKPKIKKDVNVIDYSPSGIREIMSKHKHSICASQTRAKNKVYDLSRSNEWEWFITITFNPAKIDRYDYSACSKAMSKWLKNTRQRYAPDLKYIIVSELHKDGAYHFHGMFSDVGNLKFVDSGLKSKKGLPIYNVGSFRLGFTTATRIQDTTATALYICKYITKDLSAEVKGRKRYWRSENLIEPEEVKYHITNKVDMLEWEMNCKYKKVVEQHFGSFKRMVTYYEFREE